MEGTTELTLSMLWLWCKAIDSELMDMRSKHSRENAAYAAVEATSGVMSLLVDDFTWKSAKLETVADRYRSQPFFSG